MRDVPPRRSDLRAGRPPGLRDLPSAARSSSRSAELRELPCGRSEDGPWASHRLCDMSSSARTRRTDGAPELRELPCGRNARRSASHPAARRLRDLPHRTRGDRTRRSQDLRELSSRSRESRARGAVLRGLPSIQSGRRSTVSADLEIAGGGPKRAGSRTPGASLRTARHRSRCSRYQRHDSMPSSQIESARAVHGASTMGQRGRPGRASRSRGVTSGDRALTSGFSKRPVFS